MSGPPADPASANSSPRLPEGGGSTPATTRDAATAPPASTQPPVTGIAAALSPERAAAREDTAGGHLHIPYTDAGIDFCAMEMVAGDGTRTPHRPPDVVRQCKERWQAADRDATSEGH